jgi:voltage-gated potassium channel
MQIRHESKDLAVAAKNAGRLLLLVVGSVGSLLVAGTIGYRTIEGWSIAESLYMTAITISTVGFSEVRTLSPLGRLFTVVLIFFGLFTVSVIGAHIARMLIDSEVRNIFGRKRMRKDITGLRKHYVVCGYGRIGSTICSELGKAGIDFVIIEKDAALVEQAETEGYRILRGDATSDAVLKEAGIERAAGAIAVLNSDAHNLFISLAAREMNPTIKIIARGEEAGVESRLLRAGADVVVSPLKLGGHQIAHMLLKDLQPAHQSLVREPIGLMLQQIHLTDATHKTVADLVRENHGQLAVAIQRLDGRVEMMPAGESVVNAQDSLFVCCAAEATGPQVTSR